MADQEARRLFRIRRTLMQMLNDRGYLVADIELTPTMQDFTNKFGENIRRDDLVINKNKRDDPNEQVLKLWFTSNLFVFVFNTMVLKVCQKFVFSYFEILVICFILLWDEEMDKLRNLFHFIWRGRMTENCENMFDIFFLKGKWIGLIRFLTSCMFEFFRSDFPNFALILLITYWDNILLYKNICCVLPF